MLSTIVTGVLAVLVVLLISIGGLTVVQRVVPARIRQEHNDVAGFIYAVVGIVYAVLLALVVIAVWEQHERARETVNREANELAEIFWLAHRLPEPDGRQLQDLSQSYAEVLIEDEWALMEQGRSSPRAWALLDEMRLIIQDMEVRTRADQIVFSEGLGRIHELADARRMRLEEANEGIPSILWVVLAVGGVVTVGFTYLFGLESTSTHTFMVSALAVMIGLTLFTVFSLEYPFSGGALIGPEAFEVVQQRFETSELSDLR